MLNSIEIDIERFAYLHILTDKLFEYIKYNSLGDSYNNYLYDLFRTYNNELIELGKKLNIPYTVGKK